MALTFFLDVHGSDQRLTRIEIQVLLVTQRIETPRLTLLGPCSWSASI